MSAIIKRFIPNFFLSRRNRIIVLAYHRIDNLAVDPWQLHVTPEHFDEQLAVMKSKFNVIGFYELKEQLVARKIKRANQILITFDDAYSDNYLNAKPLLEKYNLPAVFFAPTSFIGKNTEFWNDTLVEIILHSITLPAEIRINTENINFSFQLEVTELTLNDLAIHDAWKVGKKIPTERCVLYLQLWKILQPLKQTEIEEAITQLKSLRKEPYRANKNNFTMSLEQLKDLSRKTLFDVGMHTHTHVALPNHDIKTQNEEISICQNQLETDLGIKMESIAYPYGEFDNRTIDLLKSQNRIYGFTCQKKTVSGNSPTLKLGRFQPLNINGNSFEKQLKRWFYYSIIPFFPDLNTIGLSLSNFLI